MWDAFKASTCGMYVSAIKAARAEKNSTSEELQAREIQCAKTNADTPSPSSLAELQMARRALLVHFENLTQCNFKTRAETLFEKGDKNWKLLAYLTADARTHTAIPCIHSPEGTLVRDGEGIKRAFVSYYSELHAPVPSYEHQALVDLLDPIQIPVLPDEVVTSLDATFTEKELAKAVASFPNGKLPGPDGIPAEWYKQHVELLSHRLLQLYANCLETGTLPTSFYEAHVVLLPKPTKTLSLAHRIGL